MEDKQTIVKSLERTLKQTRAGSDIVEMNYMVDEHKDEWVVVKYSFTSKLHLIDVTADSGISLLNDVIEQIHYYLV